MTNRFKPLGRILMVSILICLGSEYVKPQTRIDRMQAIEIARRDAMDIKVYGTTLEDYEVVVRETKKRWLIDFELNNKGHKGGGPQYEISKKTGKILKVIYWQ
jgi:hypothetical protein